MNRAASTLTVRRSSPGAVSMRMLVLLSAALLSACIQLSPVYISNADPPGSDAELRASAMRRAATIAIFTYHSRSTGQRVPEVATWEAIGPLLSAYPEICVQDADAAACVLLEPVEVENRGSKKPGFRLTGLFETRSGARCVLAGVVDGDPEQRLPYGNIRLRWRSAIPADPEQERVLGSSRHADRTKADIDA
jgi:hypothetical protein